MRRHTTAKSRRGGATLRLVADGGDHQDAPRFADTAVRRPGDRHDSWLVRPDDRDALRRVGADDGGRGLALDVAATLVIEHGLVVDELQAVFGDAAPRAISQLNERAARAKRRAALGGANADYLRSLIRVGRERWPVGARPATATPHALILPLRLLDRLDDATVGRALERGALPAARRWEVAATAAGQTMSEWAAWQAAAFAAELAAGAG